MLLNVDEPLSMAIRVDKVMRINEFEVLWLNVSRAASHEHFGYEIIHLFTAIATERKQYYRTRVVDNNARSRAVNCLLL